MVVRKGTGRYGKAQEILRNVENFRKHPAPELVHSAWDSFGANLNSRCTDYVCINTWQFLIESYRTYRHSSSNSWSCHYLLPPVHVAKCCCGPVALFAWTTLFIFYLVFLLYFFPYWLPLSFFLLQFHELLPIELALCLLQPVFFSFELVDFFVPSKTLGEEWLIRRFLYLNGIFPISKCLYFNCIRRIISAFEQ